MLLYGKTDRKKEEVRTMGNRAVITTEENFDKNGVGIYLHWNGGRDSIEGFLKYCHLRGFRSPDQDSYGWARLSQVICNFMGGDGFSVGTDTIDRLDCDNYDNGTYLIKGWEIVGREYFEGSEQSQYELVRFVKTVDACQPDDQQLGEEMIDCLLEHNADIGEVCYEYSYQIRKMKENGDECKGFEVGAKYSSYNNVVTFLAKDGYTALVEDSNGAQRSARLFVWKNGCESISYEDENGRTITVLSTNRYNGEA